MLQNIINEYGILIQLNQQSDIAAEHRLIKSCSAVCVLDDPKLLDAFLDNPNSFFHLPVNDDVLLGNITQILIENKKYHKFQEFIDDVLVINGPKLSCEQCYQLLYNMFQIDSITPEHLTLITSSSKISMNLYMFYMAAIICLINSNY